MLLLCEIRMQYISHETASHAGGLVLATKHLGKAEQIKRSGDCPRVSAPSSHAAGHVLLGKAFILAPHVGHWPFVCDDVSPPSV